MGRLWLLVRAWLITFRLPNCNKSPHTSPRCEFHLRVERSQIGPIGGQCYGDQQTDLQESSNSTVAHLESVMSKHSAPLASFERNLCCHCDMSSGCRFAVLVLTGHLWTTLQALFCWAK